MNIDFEKLRNVCSEILPIDPHIFCSHKEKKMEECTESNCPLKEGDVAVRMSNGVVQDIFAPLKAEKTVVTDNSETLRNALARIEELESKVAGLRINNIELEKELSTMDELNIALNKRNKFLGERFKSYYCNCDHKEIRIDQVPTCGVCSKPIVVEEG